MDFSLFLSQDGQLGTAESQESPMRAAFDHQLCLDLPQKSPVSSESKHLTQVLYPDS